MDPRLKKLRIQTGVVKRCGKEKLSYRKEADMQRAKIEKMKADGKDEADIKKMNEVLKIFFRKALPVFDDKPILLLSLL